MHKNKGEGRWIKDKVRRTKYKDIITFHLDCNRNKNKKTYIV